MLRTGGYKSPTAFDVFPHLLLLVSSGFVGNPRIGGENKALAFVELQGLSLIFQGTGDAGTGIHSVFLASVLLVTNFSDA